MGWFKSPWEKMLAAVQSGNVRKAAKLVEEEPDFVKASDEKGWTLLHFAAAAGQAPVVELLLAKGADVNGKDTEGKVPLHRAAVKGHVDAMRVLLTSRADVNVRDRWSSTPLHEVADTYSPDALSAMQVLLEAGADVNAKNDRGWTATDLAAYWVRVGEAPTPKTQFSDAYEAAIAKSGFTVEWGRARLQLLRKRGGKVSDTILHGDLGSLGRIRLFGPTGSLPSS